MQLKVGVNSSGGFRRVLKTLTFGLHLVLNGTPLSAYSMANHSRL